MVSRASVRTILCALLLTPTLAAGQTTTVVVGTVRSDAQVPVAGAVVSIPSLSLTQLTNDNGLYRFVIPAERVTAQPVTVTVSSLGFRSDEESLTIRAGVTNTLDFTVASEAIELDAIVVTGTAGRMERRAQAAVVATVDAAQVQQVAPIQSVASLLQARTPGLVMRNESGTSGTAQTIRIRGITSFSNDANEPLIFIDGVRMSGQSSQIYGVGGQEGSRLNDIKVEDIESVEIVKGPAAAALYGSDANAGVINIITKRGRPQGGFTQQMSVEYGQARPNFTPPDNYARCTAANITNSLLPACAGRTAGDILIDNPLLREQPFKDGRYRNLSWSLRGGTDRYTMFMSLGADDDDGTLPNNEYGHANARTNFTFFARDNLTIDVGFGMSLTRTQLPHNDNNIYGYIGGGFLGDPRTLGGPKDGWYGNNRQSEAISALETVDRSLRIQPRLQATFTPYPWLTNRLMVGGDLLRTRAFQLWPKNDIGWFDDALLNTGEINEARRSQDRVTIDYLGNVTRSLTEAVRADVSFGMQVLTNKTDLTDASGQGLVNNDVRTVNAAARLTDGGQTSSENRQAGVFGQLQVSLWERLYVKTALRRDQSSSFGADSKPFYSPSFGVSYVLSDEPFFQNLTANLPAGLLNTLRLRAAYGVTGRHPDSGARSTFTPSTNQISQTQAVVGVRPGAVGNPDIRAEKGREIELGFETALLDDRLGVELTYFHKKTTDGILQLPVPPSQGVANNSAPQLNVGALQNKGFEIAANARPITRQNVALELRASMSTQENKLLDLGGVPETQTRKVGLPITGVWQYSIREVDLANNRIIVSDTLEFLGNTSAYPGKEGTLSATLTLFRNLSFYVQGDGRGDVSVYDETTQFRDRSNGFTAPSVLGPAAYGTDANGNPTDEAKIKWMRRFGCIPPNYGTPQQGTCGAWVTETWTDPATGAQRGGRTLTRASVRGDYQQSGAFFRLREASVSFRIPDRFVRDIARAQTASISFTARNLHTWTSFTGFDPESDQFLTVPADKRYTVRVFFTF
jgi:TonB-linked SusC/RagA family outer membrane protein